MSLLNTYSCQSIDQSDIDAVTDVLKSEYLTQGPMVKKFESSVADFTGARFGCAVSSATAGLHIGLIALGIKPGDHVWTTPNTFVATANAALYCGAKVDLIDIDQSDLNMDLDLLEHKLLTTSHNGILPKVIIPVHFGGNPVDMKRLSHLSERYQFKVLEDGSHALGSKTPEEYVGACKYSDAAVFSFHPVKPITCGEGGIITCNSEELYESLCSIRSHGITKNVRQSQKILPEELYYEQESLGWNYRLSDIHAALGNSQLLKIRVLTKKREELRHIYEAELASFPIQFQTTDQRSASSNHLLVARFTNTSTRNKVHDHLRQLNIATSFHYIPIYRHPYHRSLGDALNFPVMEHYYSTGLTLPLHCKLTKSDVIDVVKSIQEVLNDDS